MSLNVVLVYGFLESAGGQGAGLAAIGRTLSDKYGATVTICEWADEKLTDSAFYLQLGLDYVASKPLLVVGYSFGGCAAVEFAEAMNARNLTVDSLILLDPVPTSILARMSPDGFVIPENVSTARCFWRGFGNYPLSHPIGAPDDPRNEIIDHPHTDFAEHAHVREHTFNEAALLASFAIADKTTS